MNKVITISREFGSGGRELGALIAQRFHIPFYDKELIFLAAQGNTLSAEVIEQYEEHLQLNTLWSAGQNLLPFYQQPITDQIYFRQCEIIRKLAKKGPCVIVGRCADKVLDDTLRIFAYADMKARIERKIRQGIPGSVQEVEHHIKEIYKKRRHYYEHYTDVKWGDIKNYHLCINTTHNSLESCADAVAVFAKHFRR